MAISNPEPRFLNSGGGRYRSLLLSALLFGLALLVYGLVTIRCSDSWNDLSRMAAIQSVVERGDWRIAPSDFAPLTFDKVFIGGHYYSDKTPTLNLIGAGVYALLRNGFGVRLAACAGTDVPMGYYWLTVLIIGVGSALLLVLFMAMLRRLNIGAGMAFALSVVLGFGTERVSYSAVFNHHVLSAAAIMSSLYALWAASRAGSTGVRLWLMLAGFLAGLAATLDLLAGIFAAGLFGLALLQHRRRAIFFVLGALPPLILMLALDYQMIGSVVPPYMVPNGYKFPGSRFSNTVAGNRPPSDIGQYAFEMLVGVRGILAYCPLLLFALAGLVNVMRDRKHPLLAESWMTALCSAVLVGYLVTSTYNFGGTAYGERWLVVLVPLIFLFIIYAPPFMPMQNSILRAAATAALAVALVLSIGSAAQGALNPWKRTAPPIYLTLSGDSPIGVGLEFTWR